MKRKIIAQGNGAYTITLPKKWIESQQITKNDELDVVTSDEGLVIKKQNIPIQKEITIDINSTSLPRLRTAMASAYRQGASRIHVIESLSYLQAQQLADKFIGVILDTHTQNRISYTITIGQELQDFDQLCIRMLHIMTEIQNAKKSESVILKQTQLQLRDLAHRIILTKYRYDSKSADMHTIIAYIEKSTNITIPQKVQPLVNQIKEAYLKKDVKMATKLNHSFGDLMEKTTDFKIHFLFALTSRIVSYLI